MPTIAFDVLDYIDSHRDLTQPQRQELLNQIPAQQWADPNGHWRELSEHCCQRVEVQEEPRFMNRLGFYRIQPLPRCLFRSPDGRGLAWLKSGGEVESYGRCEQRHCERAKQSNVEVRGRPHDTEQE